MSYRALLSIRPAGEGGWIGYWAPGIGDPSLAGWATVGLYLIAAIITLWVGFGTRATLARHERLFYRLLGFVLIALGVNKQLDLQTAFTEMGRILAARGGWYDQRRRVQRLFILGVGLGAFAAAAVGVLVLRRTPRATKLAFLGSLGLAAFVVIRASSFHHVDVFIHQSSWWGMKFNWLIEMGAISVVIAGASYRAVQARRDG